MRYLDISSATVIELYKMGVADEKESCESSPTSSIYWLAGDVITLVETAVTIKFTASRSSWRVDVVNVLCLSSL